jgi:GntR family transcriptional regulator
MDIVISASSGKPIYLQIYEQIAGQVLRGEIVPETKLPPIRTVALDLRVSVIPVKRAWEQLEREGFITTAAGRGTTVAQLAEGEINVMRNNAAERMLFRDVEACRALGLSCPEILDIVRQAYAE